MTRYLWILAFAGQLARGEQPIAAKEAAPENFEVVLYSDFQCPFCRQFSQPIRDLMIKGVEGVKTKVTFKQFPLSFHPDAQLAAQAALAAGEQGKFWEMHDLIFANQPAIKREDLVGYGKKLGLDIDRFRKDLDSERMKQLIASDQAEGAKQGVSGTPTFFINGVEAAMAAAKQGHFWDFATYILEHQDSLREQDLVVYAGKLGMDETKFAEIIQRRRYGPRVDADLAEGAKRGIRGSPVIFVNSKRIDGVPSLKTLTEYVEAELAAK